MHLFANYWAKILIMIDILLSTYNGERFLREQIDSLLQQSFTDWKLLIRDDGSIDNSVAIIAEYAKSFPKKIAILSDNAGNLGPAFSFEKLLAASTAPYIMFCDQDDVWLPNKIKITLEKMREMEQKYGKDLPLLVHTDLQVVDSHLKVIANSMWEYMQFKPEISESDMHFLAVGNCVTGCTVMINQKAKQISLPFHKRIIMHDAYIALCVMKYGKVSYSPIPTIKYRQHGKNECGAKAVDYSLWHRLQKLKWVMEDAKKNYLNAKPLVFKNYIEFWYYKVKLFIIKRKSAPYIMPVNFG